jgi:hypothetical protein
MFIRAITLSLFLIPAATAHVVFSSFGPGGSYSPSFYYTDTLGTPPFGSEVGFAFSPSASGDLTRLRAPLMRASGANFSMRISIYRESTALPGDLVGSWTASPTSFPGPPPVVNYPIPSGIFVTSGSTYFLTVKTLSLGGGWNWFASSPNIPGRQIYQWNGQPWTNEPNSSLPAFELSIPTPTTALTLISGLTLLAARRCRAKSASFNLQH